MRQLKIQQQITNRETASLDKYFSEISKEKMICAEEEAVLAKLVREGDQRALDIMVKANLRFVVSVAKQYQGKGLSLSDLINEGNLGLIKAAKKFDETRGFKFISYAVWWIRQSISQAILDHTGLVRIPANRHSVNRKIKRDTSFLEQKLEREPTQAELVELGNLTVTEIETSARNRFYGVSLDSLIPTSEGQHFIDVIEDKSCVMPNDSLMQDSIKTDIRGLLTRLSARESEIICLYYGIGVEESYTLDEIGTRLDLTRERVRQVKEGALKKLKSSTRSKGIFQFLD